LTNGHPLKISAHSAHFALIDRNSAILDEGILGIVELSRAISPCIISNLWNLG